MGYLFNIDASPIMCKCVQKSTGLKNIEISYQIRGFSYVDKKVLKALKSNNRKNGWKLKFESNFFLKSRTVYSVFDNRYGLSNCDTR